MLAKTIKIFNAKEIDQRFAAVLVEFILEGILVRPENFSVFNFHLIHILPSQLHSSFESQQSTSLVKMSTQAATLRGQSTVGALSQPHAKRAIIV